MTVGREYTYTRLYLESYIVMTHENQVFLIIGSLLLLLLCGSLAIAKGKSKQAPLPRNAEELSDLVLVNLEKGDFKAAKAQLPELCRLVATQCDQGSSIPGNVWKIRKKYIEVQKPVEAKIITESFYTVIAKAYDQARNPNSASELNWLAEQYSLSGYSDEAEAFMLGWIEFVERKFGKDSPKTAAALCRYAQYLLQHNEEKFLRDRRLYSRAKEPIERAISILRNAPPMEAYKAPATDLLILNSYFDDNDGQSDYRKRVLTSYREIAHKFESSIKNGHNEPLDVPVRFPELQACHRLVDVYMLQHKPAKADELIDQMADCIIRTKLAQGSDDDIGSPPIPENIAFPKIDFARDLKEIVAYHKSKQDRSIALGLMLNLQSSSRGDWKSTQPSIEREFGRAFALIENWSKALLYMERVVFFQELRTKTAGESVLNSALKEYAEGLRRAGRSQDASKIQARLQALERKQ